MEYKDIKTADELESWYAKTEEASLDAGEDLDYIAPTR